ncbi:MAG: ATP-binding cassette domain-containing protein [Tepidisphaeraceae bacterium]
MCFTQEYAWNPGSRPDATNRSSARARLIADWFALDRVARSSSGKRNRTAPALGARALCALLPAPGQIVLLTGPSGSGKSTLMRALFRRSRRSCNRIDLDRIRPADTCIIDCLPGLALDATLSLLGRVGLAEAWTFLKRPRTLSQGQRWRLRLALGIAKSTREPGKSPRSILFVDEFCANLDRVTGAIVARTLRGAITASSSASAIVATVQDDLASALQPDTIVECDFVRARIRAREFPALISRTASTTE